jgi:PPOX class probable F420-dependent enzyme
MQINPNTEFGARVQRHLQDERVIWLTTVRPDGTPEPNPVWFLWDGATYLIYGMRDSRKLAHIKHDARVSLNFNADAEGGDVVVFTGEARVDSAAPPADQNSAYLAKYGSGIQQIGMTPASFAREYPDAIRVTPTHVRGM